MALEDLSATTVWTVISESAYSHNELSVVSFPSGIALAVTVVAYFRFSVSAFSDEIDSCRAGTVVLDR